jgi:hypothetical protein
MGTSIIYGEDWFKVRTHLPTEIEDMAVESGALLRRRQIRSAEMLLRILLSYVCGKNSLEKTVAAASRKGWAKMSANALHLRLRGSEGFLEKVLLGLLSRSARISSCAQKRIRIVDATFLSAPGASTSDFTLHMQYDPSTGCPVGLEVADGHSGESFRLHKFSPGDLVLGDRAYGKCRGIDSVLQQGADVLVRLYVPNIRLVDAHGVTMRSEFLASQVPEEGCAQFELSMPVPPGRARPGGWKTSEAARTHPVRVIATRIQDDEIMWLLTNLRADELSAQDALAMYRGRWQIELFFKRLKSILDLDELPTRDPTSARPWILLKVIAAILALRLSEGDFFPCATKQDEEPQSLEEHERRILDAQGVPGRADPRRQTPPKRPTAAQGASAQATLFLEDGLAAVPA